MSTAASSMYARFDKYVDKTFNDAADRYIAEFQKKSLTRVVSSIDAVRPYIGKLRLIDIDDEVMQQFKVDRMNGTGHFKRKAMVGTANKDLTQVVTVLNRACKVWRWLPSTPLLIHIEGPARAAYPISWQEQDLLFRALPSGWDVGAALFAVNTGVRKAELFGLRWTDEVKVPELDTFVFVLNTTKNGRSRAVICNSIARRAVDYQRKWQVKYPEAAGEFVFPSGAPGRNGSQCRSSGKVWSDAWKRAGLPCDKLTKRGLHNLRHTFGHRLRAAGVPVEDRNSLLGHSNHNLAQHYALPDLRRLLDAAESVTIRRETTVLRSAQHSDRATMHPIRNS